MRLLLALFLLPTLFQNNAEASSCSDNQFISIVCTVGAKINNFFQNDPSCDATITQSQAVVNVPAPAPTGCYSASQNTIMGNMPTQLLQAPLGQSSIQLDSQTQDSGVRISGSLSPAIHFLVITITNTSTGEKHNEYLPVTNCGVQKLYLHGAGKYSVEIWGNLSTNSFDVSRSDYLGKFSVDNQDQRNLDGLLPSPLVESDDPGIIQLAQSIVANANAKTDAEKAQAIHNWVASNTKYDAVAYFNDAYKTKVYDALYTLHNPSICDGYAHLFAAIARAAGLRTHVVHGQIIWPEVGQNWTDNPPTSQTHTWDQVFVNGRWVDIDTTWDSGYMNFKTQQFTPQLYQKYFDFSTDPSDSTINHHFQLVTPE